MATKYVSENGLLYFWQKLKELFVTKEPGKGLSANDYTSLEKAKLANIAEGATNYTHPSTHSADMIEDGTNNKVYTAGEKNKLAGIATGANVSPAISTDITADAASDAKTASPKAVKTYVDNKLSSAYRAAGSVAFASLPTPAAGNLGNVYNITDSFTTTAAFVEGTGKAYPAGTNVVVVYVDSSYRFDVMAGFVDLSGYAKTSDIVAITNAEVDVIVAS